MRSIKDVVCLSKMGLILATFSALGMGQSLNTFACSPASIAAGASLTCTVSITSAASLTGFPIRISTTATGLTFPGTVTIPWGRTSSSFPVTTSTSTAPQTVTIRATAGTISKSDSATITATATYSVTSLSCSPAKLIPDQTASCVAYLSAEAPAGGLVASVAASSTHLSVPSSVSIPATGTGFTFQAKASAATSSIENITVTSTVKSNNHSTQVTIDPTPKFYLKGNNRELSVLANGAGVFCSVCPAGWVGSLTVRGSGYVAFHPIVSDSGISFHANGGQNTNTAFVNFSGTPVGQVFENASEVSFRLKSAYSYAERKLLPQSNMRAVFEVFDNLGPWYSFNTYTSSTGALQFAFGARGYSAVYTVPAGREDVLFGKDVVAHIRITWTNSSFSLYVNGILVRTATVAPKAVNWSSQSAFTIGSRSVRTAGGGYYASDDAIAEFIVR